VAAVNDYDLIVQGVSAVLREFEDRIAVCDAIVLGDEVTWPVDVALYDTYGRVGVADRALRTLHAEPNVGRVAVFSLDFRPALVADARAAGAQAFISKALPGEQIADAIVRVASGEEVEAYSAATRVAARQLDWPGKGDGLTERESQVLVLCAEGMTNAEIAAALYIGAETVKSHLRNAFRRIGLRNRTQAAAYVERSGAFARYRPATLDPADVHG
jgi:DNA-binding NarL/FixJ family response regulator